MWRRQHSLSSLNRLLALCALALAACAAPAAVPPTAPPTAAPTEPATATAVPTANAATVLPTTSAPVPATSVYFRGIADIAFENGNLYVAQCHQIDKVDEFNLLTEYAGHGVGGFAGDGGPAVSAEFSCAPGIAFDGDGNLYLADFDNNRIRRIDRGGMISTVAGSGPANHYPGGFAGDGGPATLAQLYWPTAAAFDSAGNLYIADAGNNRIRKVDQQGIITTFAGSGQAGFAGDGGPATAAQLYLADLISNIDGNSSIAVDVAGNVYVADVNNNRVRKIDKQGIITTVVGTGAQDFSGDGGLATDAGLPNPTGLAIDAEGDLYVGTISFRSTHSGGRVRKIGPHGIITTVAGGGEPDVMGDDGPATAASIGDPKGLDPDSKGNLYIADSGNGRVRRVDKNGIITTVVGGRP